MNKPNFKNNIICLGDNINILKQIPKESVDLIYLDPPFNSKRNYIIVDEGKTGETEVKYFKDVWKGGSNTFLEFLFDRLLLMRQCLKSTGSIYLHCDPTESHYIKMMMDNVFGRNNFINEIIWSYQGTGEPKKFFKKKHDTILLYGKSNKYYFSDEGSKENISDFSKSKYTKKDIKGNYKEIKHADGKIYKQYQKEKMRMRDVWELPIINAMAKERVKYPTQKPLKLLERIILASSNENDVVLDPFMGSGTTLVAAAQLKRKFIGIDMSASALTTAQHRLDEVDAKFDIYRSKFRYEDIRNMEPFAFERQVVEELGGIPNEKQRGDMGIDGYIVGDNRAVIQVKRSDKVGRNVIDNFATAMRREKVSRGIIVAFSFGKGAWQEAARQKREEGLDIELKEIKTFIPINEPPKAKFVLDDNSIKVIGEDSDGEIVNYSWSIDNKMVKLTGKKGILDIKNLTREESHIISCKATDNEGSSVIIAQRLEDNKLIEIDHEQ